ncbi:hypothetical protein SAMN05661086_02774 [Anaeromicropila populeti]|uniref:1,4-beta-xylanase n=2 Tax=Anaeromicropila populeti TaxID=37658 RepID=A0A1I6KW70_9FIRM|nr:hypothetical protein SAMN05661086_02774 [Anaeromicropila populeti]
MMRAKTACNAVIIVLGALQETFHTEWIDYKHHFMPTDEELADFIQYSRSLGLKVILKPIVNCKDGTVRSCINFSEQGLSSEGKWVSWFLNYTDYQIHYARLAKDTKCDMLIFGSQLVKTEHKEKLWREVISQVREYYNGQLCYEADKYQEDGVRFWDAVDVIGTSGYYGQKCLGHELDRIKKIVEKYHKTFVITECGCKSCEGSALAPDQWILSGSLSYAEQISYYKTLFEECSKRNFIKGIGIWAWQSRLDNKEICEKDRGYFLYGKPVCDLIHMAWKENQ